jgi:hypothetical protein
MSRQCAANAGRTRLRACTLQRAFAIQWRLARHEGDAGAKCPHRELARRLPCLANFRRMEIV